MLGTLNPADILTTYIAKDTLHTFLLVGLWFSHPSQVGLCHSSSLPEEFRRERRDFES